MSLIDIETNHVAISLSAGFESLNAFCRGFCQEMDEVAGSKLNCYGGSLTQFEECL